MAQEVTGLRRPGCDPPTLAVTNTLSSDAPGYLQS